MVNKMTMILQIEMKRIFGSKWDWVVQVVIDLGVDKMVILILYCKVVCKVMMSMTITIVKQQLDS